MVESFTPLTQMKLKCRVRSSILKFVESVKKNISIANVFIRCLYWFSVLFVRFPIKRQFSNFWLLFDIGTKMTSIYLNRIERRGEISSRAIFHTNSRNRLWQTIFKSLINMLRLKSRCSEIPCTAFVVAIFFIERVGGVAIVIMYRCHLLRVR